MQRLDVYPHDEIEGPSVIEKAYEKLETLGSFFKKKVGQVVDYVF
jgi:hypothetical protein